MGIELALNEYTFRMAAAAPILALGLYVWRANSKEATNRVFALFCLTWFLYIWSINIVSLSTDTPTAEQWNRYSVYTAIFFLPALIHFVLVFPFHSGLLKQRWLVPLLYLGALAILVAGILDESLLVRPPEVDTKAEVYGPNASPLRYFLSSLCFTIASLFLVLRYVFSELEVTRKRLFFVSFGFTTYSLYEAVGDVHISRDVEFTGAFSGNDRQFWELALATDAFLIIAFFALLGLLAFRTSSPERRREALLLFLSGLAALLFGYADPILRSIEPLYPGILWLVRLVSVWLMFYAILRYQLFDLHVKIRIGVKYSSMTTIFAVVFFVVQETVKDFGGQLFGGGSSDAGYVIGLLAAAGLVFLFTPFQRVMERFSNRVVPPTSTENYEKYRSMEIYRAALEGAMADKVVTPGELQSLKNLRAKLGVTEADHSLLERDIRLGREKGAAP